MHCKAFHNVLIPCLLILSLLFLPQIGSSQAIRVQGDDPNFFHDADHSVSLLLYVDPAGGSNACSTGLLAGSYPLALDRQYNVYLHSWDYIYKPYHLFEQYEGKTRNTAREREYFRALDKALLSRKSSFCAVIVDSWSKTLEEQKGAPPLREEEMQRLRGRFESRTPPILFEVRGPRVSVYPKRACCTDESSCAKEIFAGKETCPIDTRSTDNGTGCGACSSLPKLPPKDDPTRFHVACCTDEGCTTKYTEAQCGMLGSPLPRGVTCVGSGTSDPCKRFAGACILPAGDCREGLTDNSCYQLHAQSRYLPGSPCPKDEGGCCDPMGMCRVTKKSECNRKGDEYFQGGCPDQCPEHSGACTLSCPNDLGINCLSSTAFECMKAGGSKFTPGQLCPEDPVLLKCTPPPCHECQELVNSETNYWPTMGGQLYLRYSQDQCSLEFIDGFGAPKKGTWECIKEKPRDRVRIQWQGGSEFVDLEVVRDAGFVLELRPIEKEKPLARNYPCDRSLGLAGSIIYDGIRRMVRRDGRYLCEMTDGRYAEINEEQKYINVFYLHPTSKKYEFAYKVGITWKGPSQSGGLIYTGKVVDNTSGSTKKTWEYQQLKR